MPRTLEDIERDLKFAQDELKPIQEARDAAVKKVNQFYYEAEKYKLDNGIYHPISELSNYVGKCILYIKLVEKSENDSFKIVSMFNDDVLEIDDGGHLYYSSEFGGVMDFDEKIGKYVMWTHHCRAERDFVGFLEIELEEDD